MRRSEVVKTVHPRKYPELAATLEAGEPPAHTPSGDSVPVQAGSSEPSAPKPTPPTSSPLETAEWPALPSVKTGTPVENNSPSTVPSDTILPPSPTDPEVLHDVPWDHSGNLEPEKLSLYEAIGFPVPKPSPTLNSLGKPLPEPLLDPTFEATSKEDRVVYTWDRYCAIRTSDCNIKNGKVQPIHNQSFASLVLDRYMWVVIENFPHPLRVFHASETQMLAWNVPFGAVLIPLGTYKQIYKYPEVLRKLCIGPQNTLSYWPLWVQLESGMFAEMEVPGPEIEMHEAPVEPRTLRDQHRSEMTKTVAPCFTSVEPSPLSEEARTHYAKGQCDSCYVMTDSDAKAWCCLHPAEDGIAGNASLYRHTFDDDENQTLQESYMRPYKQEAIRFVKRAQAESNAVARAGRKLLQRKAHNLTVVRQTFCHKTKSFNQDVQINSQNLPLLKEKFLDDLAVLTEQKHQLINDIKTIRAQYDEKMKTVSDLHKSGTLLACLPGSFSDPDLANIEDESYLDKSLEEIIRTPAEEPLPPTHPGPSLGSGPFLDRVCYLRLDGTYSYGKPKPLNPPDLSDPLDFKISAHYPSDDFHRTPLPLFNKLFPDGQVPPHLTNCFCYVIPGMDNYADAEAEPDTQNFEVTSEERSMIEELRLRNNLLRDPEDRTRTRANPNNSGSRNDPSSAGQPSGANPNPNVPRNNPTPESHPPGANTTPTTPTTLTNNPTPANQTAGANPTPPTPTNNPTPPPGANPNTNPNPDLRSGPIGNLDPCVAYFLLQVPASAEELAANDNSEVKVIRARERAAADARRRRDASRAAGGPTGGPGSGGPGSVGGLSGGGPGSGSGPSDPPPSSAPPPPPPPPPPPTFPSSGVPSGPPYSVNFSLNPSNIRASAPTKFAGDVDKLNLFIHQLDTYFVINQITDDNMRIVLASQFFTDEAFRWYQTLITSGRPPASYATLITALKARFIRPSHSSQARATLQNPALFFKDPETSVEKHFSKFSELVALASVHQSQLDPTTQAQLFYNSLDETLRSRLASCPTPGLMTDINVLLNTCAQLETIILPDLQTQPKRNRASDHTSSAQQGSASSSGWQPAGKRQRQSGGGVGGGQPMPQPQPLPTPFPPPQLPQYQYVNAQAPFGWEHPQGWQGGPLKPLKGRCGRCRQDNTVPEQPGGLANHNIRHCPHTLQVVRARYNPDWQDLGNRAVNPKNTSTNNTPTNTELLTVHNHIPEVPKTSYPSNDYPNNTPRQSLPLDSSTHTPTLPSANNTIAAQPLQLENQQAATEFLSSLRDIPPPPSLLYASGSRRLTMSLTGSCTVAARSSSQRATEGGSPRKTPAAAGEAGPGCSPPSPPSGRSGRGTSPRQRNRPPAGQGPRQGLSRPGLDPLRCDSSNEDDNIDAITNRSDTLPVDAKDSCPFAKFCLVAVDF